jgi:phospholipase C
VQHWELESSHGWYDLSITLAGSPIYLRQLAGHVETGRPSISDPALGLRPAKA